MFQDQSGGERTEAAAMPLFDYATRLVEGCPYRYAGDVPPRLRSGSASGPTWKVDDVPLNLQRPNGDVPPVGVVIVAVWA